MTTDNSDCFPARAVTKRLFWRRGAPPILVVMVIREDGLHIDLESFRSDQKAYTVYRKIQENRAYSIRYWGPMRQPDPQYSTSDARITAWRIEDIDNGIELDSYFKCSTNLQNTINVLKTKTASILAMYKSHEEGPGKNFFRGEYKIQGYYVHLMDESGREFRVLVWHPKAALKGSKFPLFRCNYGDIMLIPCVRSSFLPPGSQSPYTLTSLWPPVLDSKCVEPRRITDLKKKFRRSG